MQKQIAAYSGDTSQEGLAKLQKLQKELSDKEEDLRETEYDRYISDQQDMLDRLYEEYNELMQKKMDDFMTLVREGLQTSNNNTFAISSYLNKIAKENGYIRENDGTAEVLGAGISGNVDQTISNIATEKGERSGTNPPKDNSGGLFQKKEGTNTQGKKQNFSVKEKAYKTDYKETAENYIRKHASKASKKRSEYSDINKAVYDNKGKLYKGKGKVLSSKELTALAKQLMVEYDGDKSKKGVLYKRLKSLKVPGFRKGGIVSVDDIEKQVKSNGDDGIVSVKNGEGILTPVETEMFQKFTDKMPEIMNLVPNMSKLIEIKNPAEHLKYLSDMRSTNNVVNIDMGGITMNGVNNPEEFKNQMIYSIQNYQKVQNVIHGVESQRLMGGGTLGVNMIK